jgi:hypothetical protein
VDAQQPEIRIGDSERREIDDRLRAALNDGVLTITEYDERAAQCWAARTRRELDALVVDLPMPRQPEQATEKLPAPAPSAILTGLRDERTRNRILGGVAGAVVLGVGLLFGVPALGADDGMSLFSGREVQVTDQDAEVGVLFGSTQVVVPDDAYVRTNGTVVFGGLRCGEACIPQPGQREIVVNGSGAFGSIEVVRQAERAREIQQDLDEERREQLEDQQDELREQQEDREDN